MSLDTIRPGRNVSTIGFRELLTALQEIKKELRLLNAYMALITDEPDPPRDTNTDD